MALVVSPGFRHRSPPLPLLPVPIAMVMEPARPPVAVPVESEIDPEFPALVVPVLNEMVPLTPVLPAFADETQIFPLDDPRP